MLCTNAHHTRGLEDKDQASGRQTLSDNGGRHGYVAVPHVTKDSYFHKTSKAT